MLGFPFQPKSVLVAFSGPLLKRKKDEPDESYQFRQVLTARCADCTKGFIEANFHYIIPSVGGRYIELRPRSMMGWKFRDKNPHVYAVLVVGETISGDQQVVLDQLMEEQFKGLKYEIYSSKPSG